MRRQLNGRSESFFERQMQEAWLHYRHCETLRLQYLLMYLTALVAAITAVVSLLTKQSGITGSLLFAVVIIIGIMFLFSMLIYVITVRLNMITNFYGDVMDYSRNYFFEKGDYASAAWDYRVIGLHPQRAGLFSIAGSLIRFLYFNTACLIATQILNVVLIERMLSWHSVRSWLTMLMVVTMIVVFLYFLRSSQEVMKKNRLEREQTNQFIKNS